eukprot:3054088-Karenia_brevis.AAC.1
MQRGSLSGGSVHADGGTGKAKINVDNVGLRRVGVQLWPRTHFKSHTSTEMEINIKGTWWHLEVQHSPISGLPWE